MKVLLWWLTGLVVAFALLALAFGYFDPELADGRRGLGCALIAAGIAMILPAVRRLVEDWPRLKPRHSVDLAFGQIGLGLAVLVLAGLLGGRFGAFMAPLTEPKPSLTAAPEPNEPAADRPGRGGAVVEQRPAR